MDQNNELVSTDDTSLTVNGTKYRISISVRHKTGYTVHCSAHRIKSTTPHDTIGSRSRRVGSMDGVQDATNELVEWAKEHIKSREEALDLDVNIGVSVNNDE